MNEELDDELSQMYEAEKHSKVLDASFFQTPIKNIPVRKPVTLKSNRTVAEALKILKGKKIGCILVTENDKIAGIFTERDVLQRVAGVAGADKKTLRDVMTSKVEALLPDDSIAFVLNTMHVGGYRHVPVVDEEGSPLAVISIKDVVAYMLEHFSEEVINLPPRPIRSTTEREGA